MHQASRIREKRSSGASETRSKSPLRPRPWRLTPVAHALLRAASTLVSMPVVGATMPKVYLIGAGPGDPDLITLKAKRLLEQADTILYDHLANAELLNLAPQSAERIYVGKKKADHALTQKEI